MEIAVRRESDSCHTRRRIEFAATGMLMGLCGKGFPPQTIPTTMKTPVNAILKSALLASVLGASASYAGDPVTTTTTPAPAPEEDFFSGTLNLDYNSHFVSYGLDVWGDGNDLEGPTFNPALELTWGLPANFSLILGTWWDVNGKVPSAIGGKLQEIDVWAGLGYKVGDLSITALYQNWIYGS